MALTINAPTDATTGGTVTITWSSSSSDPSYFTIELVNPSFHNTFAIANNVLTSLGQLTIQLPQVPIECVSCSYNGCFTLTYRRAPR